MTERNNEPMSAHLDALRLGYLERLPEKLQAVASGWERVCRNEARDDAEKELRRALHALVGTAGTFGCKSVADIARRFEWLLKEAAVAAWESGELFYRQGAAYLQWLEEAAAFEKTVNRAVLAEAAVSEQPLAAALETDAAPIKFHADGEPC